MVGRLFLFKYYKDPYLQGRKLGLCKGGKIYFNPPPLEKYHDVYKIIGFNWV